MNKLLIIVFCLRCFFLQAQKIETALVYTVHPADGSEKRPPLLLLLHGYGSNERDLFTFFKALDSRFITVAVRAPNIMGNGAYNWFEFSTVNGVRTYDYQSAVKSRKRLLSFISKTCRELGADSNRVFVLGFSQGAMLSYELGMAAPSKIKGIVALSGSLMDETKKLITDANQLKKLALFIAHGKSDQVIALEEYRKVDLFFREKHIPKLTSVTYEMQHNICGAELNDVKAWLTRTLNEKSETLTK